MFIHTPENCIIVDVKVFTHMVSLLWYQRCGNQKNVPLYCMMRFRLLKLIWRHWDEEILILPCMKVAGKVCVLRWLYPLPNTFTCLSVTWSALCCLGKVHWKICTNAMHSLLNTPVFPPCTLKYINHTNTLTHYFLSLRYITHITEVLDELLYFILSNTCYLKLSTSRLLPFFHWNFLLSFNLNSLIIHIL